MNKYFKSLNLGVSLLCIFFLNFPDGIDGLLVNIMEGFDFRRLARFIVVLTFGLTGLILFIQSKKRIEALIKIQENR
jgi:hypothetical protein